MMDVDKNNCKKKLYRSTHVPVSHKHPRTVHHQQHWHKGAKGHFPAVVHMLLKACCTTFSE